MKLEKEESSGAERSEATVAPLRKLRAKLVSDDISRARLAAYNLSWMQEDGLEILREVLIGDFPRTAKKAAAYGLRRMHGRMKKMACEVLEEGAKHRDRSTREACVKSLVLMRGGTSGEVLPCQKPTANKQKIEEIPGKQRATTKQARQAGSSNA